MAASVVDRVPSEIVVSRTGLACSWAAILIIAAGKAGIRAGGRVRGHGRGASTPNHSAAQAVPGSRPAPPDGERGRDSRPDNPDDCAAGEHVEHFRDEDYRWRAGIEHPPEPLVVCRPH